jgi:uncharacterized protein (UPF0248 family)
MNPRDVLNKIKWSDEFSFSELEVWYIHRGAPNNTKILSGEDIQKIEKTFIETNSTMIPMHRVFKIQYKGKTIFKR